MLMVIQSMKDQNSNTIHANTTFLVAAFEAGRLKLLDTALAAPITTIIWQEHWNPYKTLLEEHFANATISAPKIMVEAKMRDFVSRGLVDAGFEVVGLGGKVEEGRQIKTEQEAEIMRAVNTGTVSAIREMRKCLVPGLTGNQLQKVLLATLQEAGFKASFALVAIGAQAASPHGGFGGEAMLTEDDLILIDVGAVLQGFESDITGRFFPPFTKQPEESRMTQKMREQLFNAAIYAMQNNVSCASVDLAARNVVKSAGYGEYFTHRLGHSIGLRGQQEPHTGKAAMGTAQQAGHDSPYLNQGNTEINFKPGMVFTAEPGVYIWDKLGVRLEDVMLVKETGQAECLSCGFTGKRPESPWQI